MSKDKARMTYLSSSIPEATERAKNPNRRSQMPDNAGLWAELERLNELMTKKNRDDLDAMYNIGWENLSEDMQRLLTSYEDDIVSAKASIETYADEMHAGFEAVARYESELGTAIADLRADVTENYATISALTSFETAVGQSIAGFEAYVEENFASSSMLASVVDQDGNVTAASIVAAVNASGSSVSIDADKINMTGTTTFLTAADVGDGGSAVIAGDRVSLNLDASLDDGIRDVTSDNGFYFNYSNDLEGIDSDFGSVYTSIESADTDMHSRYALWLTTSSFINRAQNTVWPAIKISAAGRASLEGTYGVYVGASAPGANILIDAEDVTQIRANTRYDQMSVTPSGRDYVFCRDGIYFNGVKILST